MSYPTPTDRRRLGALCWLVSQRPMRPHAFMTVAQRDEWDLYVKWCDRLGHRLTADEQRLPGHVIPMETR